VELPDPKKLLLGDLIQEVGPRTDEAGAACLRQTQEYETFMYHFLRCVVVAKDFNKSCGSMKISDYVTPRLEAFAVITYVNNHDMWKSQAENIEGQQGQGRYASTNKRTPIFTNKGNCKGWNDAGMDLYYMITETIRKQRQNEDDHRLVGFEDRMQKKYEESGAGGGEIVDEMENENEAAKKRKRAGDEDELAEMMRMYPV